MQLSQETMSEKKEEVKIASVTPLPKDQATIKPVVITANDYAEEMLSDLLEMEPLQVGKFQTVDPTQALIVLQREYGIFNAPSEQKEEKNTLQYIGTKNLESCIFVYLTNAEEHFAVHIDESREINFSKILESFKNKKNLSVMLVGGYNCQTTVDNLYFVINQLIDVAKHHKTTITVRAQRLLHHNHFTENDFDFYFFSVLFERADILHRYLYNEPFDGSMLSVNPSMLKIDTSFSEEAHLFTKLLSVTNALKKYTFLSPPFKPFLEKLSVLPQGKEKFYQLFKEQFCLKAMFFWKLVMQIDIRSISASSQPCFLINLKTGELFAISGNIFTPHESYRKIKMFCTGRKSSYFLCHQKGKYTPCEPTELEVQDIIKYFIKDPESGLPKSLPLKTVIDYLMEVINNQLDSAYDTSFAPYLARDILNFIQDYPHLFNKTKKTKQTEESSAPPENKVSSSAFWQPEPPQGTLTVTVRSEQPQAATTTTQSSSMSTSPSPLPFAENGRG